MSTAQSILKNKGLRLTDCRKSVMDSFMQTPYAICQSDLEKDLSHFDRVTIYRTLNTLLEKGVIHKVPDEGNANTKYALCLEGNCSEHEHHDEHIHFKCIQCNTLRCIATVHIPPIKLPIGYTYVDSNFLVRGVCQGCQRKVKDEA